MALIYVLLAMQTRDSADRQRTAFEVVQVEEGQPFPDFDGFVETSIVALFRTKKAAMAECGMRVSAELRESRASVGISTTFARSKPLRASEIVKWMDDEIESFKADQWTAMSAQS